MDLLYLSSDALPAARKDDDTKKKGLNNTHNRGLADDRKNNLTSSKRVTKMGWFKPKW